MTTAALATNGRVTLSLARRGLRQALRRPQFLAPLVVFPSLMLAANTGGAGRATDLPGFPQVHGFLDFELGFIDRLFAAPISRYSIIAGRIAATAVLGLMTGLWFLAGGLIFGARIEGGVP